MGAWIIRKANGQPYKTRKNALASAWRDARVAAAVKVVKVTGGYMAFDTMTDYYTWKNQK